MNFFGASTSTRFTKRGPSHDEVFDEFTLMKESEARTQRAGDADRHRSTELLERCAIRLELGNKVEGISRVCHEIALCKVKSRVGIF